MVHVHHGRAADGKIPRELLMHVGNWREILYFFESDEIGVCGVVGIHATIWDWVVAVEKGMDGTIREYRMPARFFGMMQPGELEAVASR